MWIDERPYLAIYLMGSVLVVILTLVKAVLYPAIDWLTKANILKKNLKKLMPSDERSYTVKFATLGGQILVEAALSWINVVVIIIQIAITLLSVIREGFTSVPEEVKQLRYPLRNNPDMSKESVWAYIYALGIKGGGEVLSQGDIIASLEEVKANRKTFDCIVALDHLQQLGVASAVALDSAKEYLACERIITGELIMGKAGK